MNNQLLQSALGYADQGWFVFPLYGIVDHRCECGTSCGSPGKHPRTTNGLKDASIDPERITSWWKRWPNSNIGVVTGKQSGIYVIDLDNKRSVELGNGILAGEGEDSIRKKEMDFGKLTETLTSLTGSGGKHLVYLYPTPLSTLEGATFGNRSGILPSVDTRGNGGYIVAPPSLHQSGSRYQWIDQAVSPATLTEPWMNFFTTPPTNKLPLDLDVPEGLVIHEGEGRHEWLFKMGSKLRGQHGLDGVALFGALEGYNRSIIVPPLESKEVAHIVESVSKYEPAIKIDTLQREGSIPILDEGSDLAIPFAELVHKDLPEFVPLVDGLLYQGEMLIIGGPPNVGKTWLVMDMMMAIASGGLFVGHFPTTNVPVLFIDEEGSERGNKARFGMLVEGRGDLSASDYPIFSKISTGIRLDSPAGRTAITRLIERYRPGVVFLDSLVRVHGGEENSSRSMADFFRMCKRIMESYGCSFVFTHHIRKPSQNGQEDPTWMLRGSGDIQGFPDSVLVCLPRIKGQGSTELECIHSKMRHGERLATFTVELHIMDNPRLARLEYREFDPVSAANKVRSDILAVLSKGMKTAEQVAYETGMSLPIVKEHLKVMEAGSAVRSQREAGQFYYRQSKF